MLFIFTALVTIASAAACGDCAPERSQRERLKFQKYHQNDWRMNVHVIIITIIYMCVCVFFKTCQNNITTNYRLLFKNVVIPKTNL